MQNYQNMVFSTAMRLLGNEADAQDVSQEVFLRAYKHFDELRASHSAAGWLKTVATNLSLNHLTRYRSRWSFFSDLFRGSREGEDDSPEPEFAGTQNFEEDISRAERHALLEQALQRLPSAQRVPLVLFHLEGFRYEQIAARLGVSLGKVKTDISRGRAALRKTLGRKLEPEISPTS